MIIGSAFEAPAVVPGLDDIAVMGETIEQSGRHLGVAEDGGPFTEGKVCGHDDRGSLVEPTDEVEQELAPGLSERQIAEFVEDDEVHAGQVIGKPALAGVAGFGFEPIDEIDDVIEPTADAAANAASSNRNGEMGLSGTGPADQHGIALLGEESAAGEIAHEGLVDRRSLELEVVEVLSERQLGDGELVLDRARLLLVDLGGEQVADDALGFMLALDGGGHDLIKSGLHTVKLELAHEVEQLGSFH